MENRSLPLAHSTSVLGSARNRCWGNCVGGIFYGQPAETTCKEHANWYSGQGCDSFPHSPYRIHISLRCHGAGPQREFPRRQRWTRPFPEAPVNPQVQQHWTIKLESFQPFFTSVFIIFLFRFSAPLFMFNLQWKTLLSTQFTYEIHLLSVVVLLLCLPLLKQDP